MSMKEHKQQNINPSQQFVVREKSKDIYKNKSIENDKRLLRTKEILLVNFSSLVSDF